MKAEAGPSIRVQKTVPSACVFPGYLRTSLNCSTCPVSLFSSVPIPIPINLHVNTVALWRVLQIPCQGPNASGVLILLHGTLILWTHAPRVSSDIGPWMPTQVLRIRATAYTFSTAVGSSASSPLKTCSPRNTVVQIAQNCDYRAYEVLQTHHL